MNVILFLFCNKGDTSITAGSIQGSYTWPLSAGCRHYHLTPTPLGYEFEFVLGERLTFSNLQMQRRLRLDLNPRLEATYRHSQTLGSYRSRHRSRAWTNGIDFFLYFILSIWEFIGSNKDRSFYLMTWYIERKSSSSKLDFFQDLNNLDSKNSNFNNCYMKQSKICEW